MTAAPVDFIRAWKLGSDMCSMALLILSKTDGFMKCTVRCFAAVYRNQYSLV